MTKLFNYLFTFFRRRNASEPELSAIIFISLAISGLLCSADFILIHFFKLNGYYAAVSFFLLFISPITLLLGRKKNLKEIAEASEHDYSKFFGFIALFLVYASCLSLPLTMLAIAKLN